MNTQKGSATAERMIAAAETLMRERGLPAAGIKPVVALSRAPIGSVYHHFPGGKAELVSRALARHRDKARGLLEGALSGPGPLDDRLRVFFAAAARGFEEAGGLKSCAIGNVTLGLGNEDEALRRVCAESFESWIAALEPMLPRNLDASARRSFAELIVIAIEGAFVLARASRSGRPFVTAGEWLARCMSTPQGDSVRGDS